MSSPLETLKRIERSFAEGEPQQKVAFKLLPPLTFEEVRRLEAQIPCPVPEEALELFRYARGFEIRNTILHGAHRRLSPVDLSGLDGGFGLEEIFPHAVSIADDGCGNYWVLDLTIDSKSWGPILYACHDAPVIVYQTDSLAHFIEQATKVSGPQNPSELEIMVNELSLRVWRENPNVLTFEECADSADADLKAFARSLDATYKFIDLRSPKLGDGFSWGRAATIKRFREKRVFACQEKAEKTKWRRFKEFWR